MEAEKVQPHPLLIEDVLDVVFKHIVSEPQIWKSSRKCFARNVRNIRLVCQTWRESMTRIYHQYLTPVTMKLGKSDVHGNDQQFKYLARARKFLEVMKTSRIIKVQNYIITDNSFFKNKTLVNDFLNICGPEAISLSFKVNENIATSFVLSEPTNWNLARLQALDITISRKRMTSICNSNQICGFANFIRGLLDDTMALSELRIKFGGDKPMTFYRPRPVSEQIMKQFHMIVLTGLPATVRKLSLTLTNTTLQIMMGNNALKLDELDIWVMPTLESEMVKKLLKSQATTLKVLRVKWRKLIDERYGYARKLTISPMELPFLPELLQLNLSRMKVEPFQFSLTFPKLCHLDIEDWVREPTLTNVLTSPQEPATSVKKLWLSSVLSLIHRRDFIDVPISPLVYNFANYFPNLVEIYVRPASDNWNTVQEIFRYMHGLERLYIDFPDPNINLDSLLTGVPEAECERIRMLPDFEGVNLQALQLQPSILNLTKLRKLAVVSESSAFRLTDLSAHFVFLQLKNLKQLVLRYAYRVSEKYRRLLREKLSFEWADFNTCSAESIIKTD